MTTDDSESVVHLFHPAMMPLQSSLLVTGGGESHHTPGHAGTADSSKGSVPPLLPTDSILSKQPSPPGKIEGEWSDTPGQSRAGRTVGVSFCFKVVGIVVLL